MSDYIRTSNDELYHYGVKGMKWGVRRKLGVKARAAAQYKEFAKSAEKNVKRLERKAADKGLSDRQKSKLKQNRKLQQKYTSMRKKLVKDLSQKDIRQGERQIKAMPFLMGGPATAVVRVANLERANRVLNREETKPRYYTVW